ncbi:MAG TPA: hypothetical protein VL634_10340 [Mycobacterium sp.]|jgi:uncharacterized protein YfaQ (DUF2300 family)|nr:hypothetical protein [Mycobacterium sp.]
MAEFLGVTPNDLRGTSDHLYDVSARMKEILATLQERLRAEGVAWGDDEMGEQFAGGGGGYLAQLKWVDGSVGAKTDLLDYYSRALKGAADSFERNDQA